MGHDQKTTLSELKSEVAKFVEERNWEKFHTPKNISMALAVEAAELMEHFQWLQPKESIELAPDKKVAVGEEVADVFCYLMAMCNVLEIDVSSTFERKMKLNREKYPVEEFRGRFGSDDPSPVEPESNQ
ncbi:MAG: nucleotide pyrophosphohydrolase [Planctomycetota bacterium]